MTNTKPWIVKHCLTDKLEETLNEVELTGYVIDKYERTIETFEGIMWIVVAHIEDKE